MESLFEVSIVATAGHRANIRLPSEPLGDRALVPLGQLGIRTGHRHVDGPSFARAADLRPVAAVPARYALAARVADDVQALGEVRIAHRQLGAPHALVERKIGGPPAAARATDQQAAQGKARDRQSHALAQTENEVSPLRLVPSVGCHYWTPWLSAALPPACALAISRGFAGAPSGTRFHQPPPSAWNSAAVSA